MESFLKKLEKTENLKINSTQPLFGGSINEVLLIETQVGKRVIKINNAHQYPKMFDAEYAGLKTLRATNSIAIPEVFVAGQIENTAYLILEYIPKGNETASFWERFAQELAALHQNTHSHFGFNDSNYIGSLHQENGHESSAADFYIQQRIQPQMELAEKKGYSFKNKANIFSNIATEIPDENPALIHGDLWSGNYLVSDENTPYLIDPAVSYGPREMDLSMMHLFGGFPSEVFAMYNEVFPLQSGFESRIQLWQLYYLLVHLNLFGGGYLNQVQGILKDYQ